MKQRSTVSLIYADGFDGKSMSKMGEMRKYPVVVWQYQIAVISVWTALRDNRNVVFPGAQWIYTLQLP